MNNIWKKECYECKGEGEINTSFTIATDIITCPTCKGKKWGYNYLTIEQYKAQTGLDWVGAFWDESKHRLYLQIFPCFGIHITWRCK